MSSSLNRTRITRFFAHFFAKSISFMAYSDACDWVERKKRKALSEEEKIAIIREHFLEGTNFQELSKKYGVHSSTISITIRKFAASNDKSALLMKNKPIDSQAEELKALRAEVLELKKKLHDETMRADFYDTMIDVAEEMFNIEIRKKAGTGQSKGCTKTK